MKPCFFRLALLVAAIFISADAWAQSSVWVVSSSRAKVYLAGSMHMLRPSDHPLPAEFFSAYENSGKIVFEVLPGEMEKPENTKKFLRASVYSDGTTLQEHITPEAFTKAEDFCKERNYPMKKYKYLRPPLFMLTLAVLEVANLGADSKKGVDYYFKEKALQDGKATDGLETADEQISFLTLTDMGVASRHILETLDELKKIDVLYTEAVNFWKKGDEEMISRRYLKRMKESPKLYQSLIVNRNKKWAKAIEGYLNGSENTMVIVGAAHLAGSDGVVSLLRQRGYKVTKLNKK